MKDNYTDAMKALRKTIEKIKHSAVTDDDMKLIEADVVAVTRILFDAELKEVFREKENTDREIKSLKAKLKVTRAGIRKDENMQALADSSAQHHEAHLHDDDDLKAQHNADQDVRDQVSAEGTALWDADLRVKHNL